MVPTKRSLWLRRALSLATVALVLIAFCVGISLLMTKWLTRVDSGWNRPMSHGHHWLHQTLELTAEEKAAIDAFEEDYQGKRDALTQTFDARIADLREILVTSDEYRPEVDVAIHQIHEIHGQLQELSIQHYYDMLQVLPPEKQAKLRELATKALSQPE